MPRFINELRGDSDLVVEKRFEPVLQAIDAGRAVVVDRAAALEQAHLRGAQREQARLAYKYGRDSVQVQTAAERVRTAERRVAAVNVEIQRGDTGVVTADPQGVVVHGLLLETDRTPQTKLTVAIVSSAGRTVARAKPDERGYFKLTTKPFLDLTPDTPTPAPGTTRTGAVAVDTTGTTDTTGKTDTTTPRPTIVRRPTRLVVLDGKREVYSENLETLHAGQSRYREVVLRAAR